jgi:hypothetical protein
MRFLRLLPVALALPSILGAAAPPGETDAGPPAAPEGDAGGAAAAEASDAVGDGDGGGDRTARFLRLALRVGILAGSKDGDKKWIAPPASPVPPGTREVPRFHFVNLYTNDHLAVFGDDVPPRALSLLLRCRATGKTHPIDPALPAIVLDAARRFDAAVVQVVSGYRHDKFNEQLRKKCREVASESYHRFGQAIDWRLQGIPVRRIAPYLLRRHRGGVGIYGRSNFVHTDTGPQRTWRGR